MKILGIVLLCTVLLLALGVGIYTVRADVLQTEALQLDAQLRRNRALEQDSTRLRAFVESPLCAKVVKQ